VDLRVARRMWGARRALLLHAAAGSVVSVAVPVVVAVVVVELVVELAVEAVVEFVEDVVGMVFEHYVAVFPVPLAVGPELAFGLVELGPVELGLVELGLVELGLVELGVLAVLAELAELADELATELADVRVVLLELVVPVVGRGAEHVVVVVAPLVVGRAGTSALVSWFS